MFETITPLLVERGGRGGKEGERPSPLRFGLGFELDNYLIQQLHMHIEMQCFFFPHGPDRKFVGPKMLKIEEVTPATRLLEKRRKMFEAQEALEAQKLDFAKQVDLHLSFLQ